MNKSNLIVCLMGPTASGKTDQAINLVRQFPLEIISVDSAMVYRGLDIGAAKPSPEELHTAPHRLINIREPNEPYSAADFCSDAKREIADIMAQGRIPFLVGGTMLYFRALQNGLSTLPPADENIRLQIFQEAEKMGWDYMHKELSKVDSVAAARIHPNDPQRLQRAWEVYHLTGKPMTEYLGQSTKSEEFNFCNIGLLPANRKWLHDRIALRFKQMLEKGLIEEVETLYRLYKNTEPSSSLPALRAVGYRQVWDYLQGNVSYDEMVEKGIAATRQLAKRQMTWLRKWEDLHIFECDNRLLSDQLFDFIEKIHS